MKPSHTLPQKSQQLVVVIKLKQVDIPFQSRKEPLKICEWGSVGLSSCMLMIFYHHPQEMGLFSLVHGSVPVGSSIAASLEHKKCKSACALKKVRLLVAYLLRVRVMIMTSAELCCTLSCDANRYSRVHLIRVTQKRCLDTGGTEVDPSPCKVKTGYYYFSCMF